VDSEDCVLRKISDAIRLFATWFGLKNQDEEAEEHFRFSRGEHMAEEATGA
jgi:hypothetical protein